MHSNILGNADFLWVTGARSACGILEAPCVSGGCCDAATHSCCCAESIGALRGVCCRCSAEAVAATTLATPPHPTGPTSTPSPRPTTQSGAALPVVRQALEGALLRSNRDFWVEVIPEIVRRDLKCFKRRRIEAMQLFLRLYILVSCQGVATPVLLVLLTVQVRQGLSDGTASLPHVQGTFHTSFCMCSLPFHQQPPFGLHSYTAGEWYLASIVLHYIYTSLVNTFDVSTLHTRGSYAFMVLEAWSTTGVLPVCR